MKYGLCTFPTPTSISPADLAIAAEERDFESLWVAEHTHIPASRKSPWPGGAELPQFYYEAFAPLLALTAAAAVTKKIKLGTGILLVPQHDPITLAKELATLDTISNGRTLFGVGGGWNVEELANHYDFPWKRRWKVMRERIEAMKEIWTNEKAEYHGEFVDFDPIFSWPKPVQQPGPPVHVAGSSPMGIKRALRYGDGWIPIVGRDGNDMYEDLKLFRKMATEAGRDPDSMEVSFYTAPSDADELKKLRDAGLSRAIFLAFPIGKEQLLPMLDDLEKVAREVG